MKHVKGMLLAALLFLPLAAVFAGPAVSILEKPALYQKDLSEDEILAYIHSEKGLLPVRLNQNDSFFDEDQKARIVKAAIEQVKAKNDHRSHYNAAVVFATYPYMLGGDEEWLLSPSDAANAIRHATIALNLSSESPENVPYMYLVRGLVRADQGLAYDGREANHTLRDPSFAKAAWADFKEVERLAPQITPYSQMSNVAGALGMKKLADHYMKLEKQVIWQERVKAAKAAKNQVKYLFGLSH